MPEVLFPYQKIRPLVHRLRTTRIQEFELERDITKLERELEHAKAVIIKAAYDAEQIDKKNKDTRSAGEADAVARSHEIAALEDKLTQKQKDLDLAKVERLALEDEVSLTRAWLYSQTRIR